MRARLDSVSEPQRTPTSKTGSPSNPGDSKAPSSGSEPLELELIAKEHAPVLHNLFELYVHDFSEHIPLQIKPNGRFDIAPGERWWTQDDHFPFFIRRNGKLSGFALVRRGSRVTPGASDVMDVAEFFVVRGARGKGVGTSAAHALFAKFRGRWEIRIRQANVSALTFWSRAVESWTGRPATTAVFSAEGIDWDVFRIGPT